ncbi:NADH dehydrogenase [ubiquinone] iron-sulfur protein 6, mitochondrial isoform X1 [Mustela nigripes]|uniref:NADH dehydrogenase [ubiquinone] iron-sulfur protein 6, mitochondrial isoform X1 n=1 Tax=Mustela nigripes TaxID=77151 RepID=UPI00281521EE|nr:NADH dehydrogenase [ubiquinone] iron-sulfur protein 6, mitochondrial isoform X1 [Mustela nigripes]
MAAAVTFCRLLGRTGPAALSLPRGARSFGVRTSPTGEKMTHTGQVYDDADYRKVRFVGRQKEGRALPSGRRQEDRPALSGCDWSRTVAAGERMLMCVSRNLSSSFLADLRCRNASAGRAAGGGDSVQCLGGAMGPDAVAGPCGPAPGSPAQQF